VISLSACLSVCVSVREHISGTTLRSLPFLRMLPMAVARSSSDGVAISYVLPVLLMTSYNAVNAHDGPYGSTSIQL